MKVVRRIRKRALREARLAELRARIAEGMDAARRGDVIDGGAVFAELRRRSEERRKR